MVKDNQKGFSLFELAIIIVIVGIIGSIVMLVWPDTAKINVNAQAQQLANDLRYVRSLAMKQETRYRVNFSSNQYSLTELNGTTAVPRPGGSGSNVVNLPGGVRLRENLPNDYIVFDEHGMPYTDNAIPGTQLLSVARIQLRARSSEGVTSIVVRVAPVTGAVYIN